MRIIFTVFIAVLVAGCTNENRNYSIHPLKDGSYSGYFNYDTLHLWESFGIKKNSFIEYASGGAMFQKYPKYCLTKGNYEIIDDSIYFYNIQVAQPPNGNLADYEEEFLLMGTYFVENYTDSTIVFRRNSKKGIQEYALKLYSELK
jgi:hypothetical protein